MDISVDTGRHRLFFCAASAMGDIIRPMDIDIECYKRYILFFQQGRQKDKGMATFDVAIMQGYVFYIDGSGGRSRRYDLYGTGYITVAAIFHISIYAYIRCRHMAGNRGSRDQTIV